MDLSYYVGTAFHMAAFMITLTCIVHTFIQKRTDKPQSKFFIMMLVLLLLNTVSEFTYELVYPLRAESDNLLHLAGFLKTFYFLLHTALLPLLGYYILCITGKIRSFTKLQRYLFAVPTLLLELLMITNPIHRQCFVYAGESLDYQRSWGVTLLYVVSAFYILFFIVNLFASWRAITFKRRLDMAYFLAMVILGIVLQMFFIKLRVELFSEALAYLGLLLTLENDGEYMDADVGIYNRKALKIDLDNIIANKYPFRVICLKIENADTIRRVTGSNNTEIISTMIFDELKNHVKRYHIYRTAPDTFVTVLTRQDEDTAKEIAQCISARFAEPWNCQNAKVLLRGTVMLARCPDDFTASEEVYDMADSPLPRDHEPLMSGKNELGYLLRERAVESAIQRGMDKGEFEVYYQPTFTAPGMVLHGAEALLRLHDEKLGEVMPNEFIPVAEHIGLIGQIDDFVLESVCDFIAGGVPGKLGMSSINVNLSVLHCIQPGFTERTLSIIEKKNVDRSMLNFEITESVDANDYDIVKSVVKKFKENGFRIYMDDYGTGYSNVQSLFSMNFDVIKIDKSILWGAEKSALGMTILESNVSMLKQMGAEVLVEGVETRAQAELLQKLGVDYLQGFYFSRPIPKDDFVKLMGEHASGAAAKAER